MSRLIDADKLKEYLGNKYMPEVKEDIDAQPTAFNVEKVVEQLEQQAKQYRRRAIEFASKDFNACKHMDGKAYSYEHAIDIVKRGGLNE